MTGIVLPESDWTYPVFASMHMMFDSKHLHSRFYHVLQDWPGPDLAGVLIAGLNPMLHWRRLVTASRD